MLFSESDVETHIPAVLWIPEDYSVISFGLFDLKMFCGCNLSCRIFEVNRLMKPFASWEQVKVIKIIPEPFSIEGGELTPTLKLKRDPIKKKYGSLIDSIYE